MELEFCGAAREVTGSCHILRVGGRTVLLDCGLFQGHRAESHAKNVELPVPVASIDAVVLSHAHMDHAGRLPYLVAQGYTKTIYCTPAISANSAASSAGLLLATMCVVAISRYAHAGEPSARMAEREIAPSTGSGSATLARM